jgi:ribonuclease D
MQLEYAANDVCYLLPLYRELTERLKQRGFLEYLRQDTVLQVENSVNLEQPGYWAKIYTGVSNAWKLKGKSLACLQALCVWREEVARSRDRPRNWIAKDNELFALACLSESGQTITVSDFRNCEELSKELVRKQGESLLNLVNAERDASRSSHNTVNPPLSPRMRRTVKAFREVVLQRADEMDIAPELLARKKHLTAVVLGVERDGKPGWPAAMAGWRRGVLERDFDNIVAGQKA